MESEYPVEQLLSHSANPADRQSHILQLLADVQSRLTDLLSPDFGVASFFSFNIVSKPLEGFCHPLCFDFSVPLVKNHGGLEASALVQEVLQAGGKG